MNTINFLEKKKLTYIIIFIFVVFALIHLYKINKQTNEGFATQNITDNVSVNSSSVYVDIPSLSQVRFDGSGLNTLLNAKADASALNSKADASALNSKADASALNSKADVSALNSKADASDLNSKANSSVVTALSNTVGSLTTNVTNLMNNPSLPELSIIEYRGPSPIPAGWQLCDGSALTYTNTNSTKVLPTDTKFSQLSKSLDNSGYIIQTPNLMRNIILNPNEANRFYNASFYKNEYVHGYQYQTSNLNAPESHRWGSEFSRDPFMRIRLDNLFNVTGLYIEGLHYESNRNLSQLTVTGYNYNHIDITNDSFLNNTSKNSVDTSQSYIIPPIDFTKGGTKIINTDLGNSIFTMCMFDNPVTCNYLKIVPLKSSIASFNLKVGVIVKPINQYIIKQPKQ